MNTPLPQISIIGGSYGTSTKQYACLISATHCQTCMVIITPEQYWTIWTSPQNKKPKAEIQPDFHRARPTMHVHPKLVIIYKMLLWIKTLNEPCMHMPSSHWFPHLSRLK